MQPLILEYESPLMPSRNEPTSRGYNRTVSKLLSCSPSHLKRPIQVEINSPFSLQLSTSSSCDISQHMDGFFFFIPPAKHLSYEISYLWCDVFRALQPRKVYLNRSWYGLYNWLKYTNCTKTRVFYTILKTYGINSSYRHTIEKSIMVEISYFLVGYNVIVVKIYCT